MEIFTDAFEKRTVLTLLDSSGDASMFRELLSQDFNVVGIDGVEECLAVLSERFAELSAVIVDLDIAKADDFAFLRSMAERRELDTIAAVVASLREPTDDLRCLDEGALDFITKPYNRGLVKRRIDNAIQLKRSTTFYEIESMLRELPSNIFLKDTEGRYVFCTHYWHHLDMGDDPHWTIRGKTDLEIRKDRENALKAMEADREIVRTGKGTTYVIEINVDGSQEFMELIKRPVFDEAGNVSGIIALINDVTEHELLKRELEERAHTDELTGLGNRRSFDEYVREIPRAGVFPIAVISADCDGLKRVNDTYGHLVGDEYLRMSALVFKISLPEDARAFRIGGDEFMAFLPGVTQARADEVVAEMSRSQELFQLKDMHISISFGTSSITGEDDPALDAIARADRAMYMNKMFHKQDRA